MKLLKPVNPLFIVALIVWASIQFYINKKLLLGVSIFSSRHHLHVSNNGRKTCDFIPSAKNNKPCKKCEKHVIVGIGRNFPRVLKDNYFLGRLWILGSLLITSWHSCHAFLVNWLLKLNLLLDKSPSLQTLGYVASLHEWFMPKLSLKNLIECCSKNPRHTSGFSPSHSPSPSMRCMQMFNCF
jgi:hypothetical protein